MKSNEIATVQDLINLLSKVENKDMLLYIEDQSVMKEDLFLREEKIHTLDNTSDCTKLAIYF